MVSPDAPALADAEPDANLGIDFTETYGPGTQDVGFWWLTTDARPRVIETTGGVPGGFLYGEVDTSIPTWTTESTRYRPGVADSFKRDSIFVGDYYANAIATIGVDLDLIQQGGWSIDRTLTLHLLSWDVTNKQVAFEAFYTLPDMPDPPDGWNHYDFQIDARSPTIPAGWTLLHGDGSPGTDAEWATFMHQIDMVAFGYWKPEFGYPGTALWQLGIDNVHIWAHP